MMMGESHHKYPYNALMRIARATPRDFWIIRLLYKAIHRRESIRVYPLWADLTRRQIEAIHEQTNAVRPGTPLPAMLGRVNYCAAHRRILAPVVGGDLGKRGRVNTHAVGAEKIVINTMTDEKFCGIRTGRIKRRCVILEPSVAEVDDFDAVLEAMPRKFRSMFQTTGDADADAPLAASSDDEAEVPMDVSDTDGDASMDQAPDAVDAASGKKVPRKRRTKKKRYTRCGIVPAPSVDMIGVMFMLYNSMYLLCPFCGHVMRYGRDKFSEIGLWCGACVRGEKALAEKLSIPWDELNECADPYLVPDAVCGVPVVKTPDATCYYCGTAPPGNRPLHYYLVYNDLGPSAAAAVGMVYVGMCENHAKWWIGKDPATLRLSTILHNFRLLDAAHLDDNPASVRRVMPRTLVDADGVETIALALPFDEALSVVGPDADAQRGRDAEHRAGLKRKRAAHNRVKAGMKRARTEPKRKDKGKGKAMNCE